MTKTQQLGFFVGDEAPRATWNPGEIWEALDEGLLQSLREDKRIERKPAQFSGASIGEYVSMWANTEPNGVILVLGVMNDGRIEGVTRVGPDRLNEIEKAPSVFAPDARCRSKRIAVTNHRGEPDFVVAFLVEYHRTRLVKDSKGDAFTGLATQSESFAYRR